MEKMPPRNSGARFQFHHLLTCHDPDEDDEHGYGDGEELGGGEAAAVAQRDLVAFAARPEIFRF